jgi:hyperosmotically inducible periplasmic protein
VPFENRSDACAKQASVDEVDMKVSPRSLVPVALAVSLPLIVPAALHARSSDLQSPDNTATNKSDHAAGQTSADQQSNRRTDLQITRQIRRAIVADKTLSMYAHNVKIITRNGHVTLKGPVRTAQEKDAIQAKAAAVAGGTNVIDQMSVAPKKKSSTD